MRLSLKPRRTSTATGVLIALALAAAAVAYFTATGSGSASGNVTTLSVPGSPAASASGTTATITWNASAIGATVAATSYKVERYTSTGTDIGAASCSPVSSSSGSPNAFGSFTCTDSPGGGSYEYKITANYHSSWTATTGFVGPVTTQYTTSTSASGPATDSTNTAVATSSISSTLAGAGAGATGTITFKVFGPQSSAPSTCTTGGTTVGTASVAGNAAYHPSAGFTPTSAGTYWWYASYGGDSGNASSTSPCASGMSSTVVKNAPTLTPSGPASGNVGTALSASSIGGALAGATAGASGTITFKVFGPQASAPTDCSTGTTVGTATVSGNATYNPSAGFTPSSPGTYWWYVSYNGDASNSSATSLCGSVLATTVVSTAVTSLTAAAPSTDATGTAIGTGSLSAALSGATSGATGTITFKVFGPQASAPTTCTSGGTTVSTATVSGSGTYNPSAGYTPSTAGTYWWYVSYNGDSNNASSASTCGSGMTSTVVKNATTVTAAGPATDTAGTAITASAITGALAGGTSGVTGTITYTVFGPQTTAPSNCSSGGTTVGTATISGNGTYIPNAGFTPSSAGTYWWYTSYNGDTNNSASASTCGSAMTSTTVYSVSSAANANATSGSSATTTSFTVQPSTTYLLLVFRHSSVSDGVSSISTTGLSPALTLSSFTSITSQTYGSNDYQWAYYVTTSSSASGTGTLTVNFNNTLAGGQVSIVDLVALGGNNTSNPVLTGNEALASGTGATATADLTYAPGSSDSSLVFLTSEKNMPATAPAGTPAITNTFYKQQGAGSLGVFSATPGTQSESFAISTSQNWGSIALEIRRAGSTNSPTLSVGAPSTGSAGSAISAGSLSATLSGSATTSTNGVTFKVFGPQASAPTTCTTGGTTLGSAVTVSGDGTYNPTAGYTPTQAGTYWWYADYSGDQNDLHTTSTCGSGMTSTVVSSAGTAITASAPTTGTTAGISASSISAVLSGGSAPTGTITYTVFGPQATAPSNCATGGTTVGTATVTANGTYTSSAGFTPTQGGTYWWYASYNGDSNNGASTSTCGSAMPETYVYSVSSAGSGTSTTAGTTSVPTSSFTIQPSTTYLLFVYRSSSAGDGISSISSSGLTPALSLGSFTSIKSQSFTGNNYEWAYYVTTSSSASGTGTLTVNFNNTLPSGAASVVDLVQLGGNSTANPIVVGNQSFTSGTGSSGATANLPYVPGSVDQNLVFLAGDNKLGATAPTATPSMTGAFFFQSGGGSAAVYSATPGNQNESFASFTASQNWGAIALEIRRTGSANTTTSTASGPATGAAGAAIAGSSISSTLAGATNDAGNGITFTVFGPQASAPTNCSIGGTTVGTATVSGNGTYTSSASFTPTQAGTYWWYASYSGDAKNLFSSSTCGTGMSSTVVGVAASALTMSAPTASMLSGTAISAGSISATLSGGVSTPSGTITYKVFGPQASAPTTCTSGGTTVGTATVSGNGAYTSSAGFTPSSAGTYWWYASYGGDSNNSGSDSGCGAGMAATYVYSASSVSSVTDTALANNSTTSSFTVQPSTTYLLLVYRSKSGASDSITSLSSTGLSPALSLSSFTSIASQSFNSKDYEWAYWITTASNASGTGTLTLNFNNTLAAGQATIIDLVQLGGVSSTAPVVTSNKITSTANSGTATANLPNALTTGDADLVFLGSEKGLGATTPSPSPAMTNLFYSQQGAGSMAPYIAAPGAQNESIAVTAGFWGTIGFELTHP